ncbi:MAG: XdhC family protein [Acidobacteriota bacterium]
MTDHVQIAAALDRAWKSGKQVALATVVKVEGSAYRREGAKLAIEAGGCFTGLISSGCLEPEVAETAATVIDTNRPVRRRFDLRDDAVWGLGMGCGGTIEVFIEPAANTSGWHKWCEVLMRGEAAVRAIVHAPLNSAMAGQWILLTEEDEPVGRIENQRLRQAVTLISQDLLSSEKPRSLNRSLDDMEVFFDLNLPPPELLIFGAGGDAAPVVELAERLGFRTTIVDPRQAYANPERFPKAHCINVHPQEFSSKLRVPPRSYVVIMNHQLERDQAALKLVLQSRTAYVGVLGPRSRFQKLVDGLAEEGLGLSPEQLARVHNPIGLDIGAEGPMEIAVSILAEVLAVRNGFAGAPLREREGGIHED